MGLQYVTEDKQRSVLMAYRLGDSRPERVFRLRGLDPIAWYAVTVDGLKAKSMSGQELAAAGITVRLSEEWRAAVVELAHE
jgi:hypothetical protein